MVDKSVNVGTAASFQRISFWPVSDMAALTALLICGSVSIV